MHFRFNGFTHTHTHTHFSVVAGVLLGGFSRASHRASSQRWLEAVRADSGERAAASKMDFDCVCLSTIHQVNYELYYELYYEELY